MKIPHLARTVASMILVGTMVLALTACTSTAPTASDTSSSTAIATTSATPETSPSTTAAPIRTPVRIAALKGPTGMGLVYMMADQEEGTTQNDYSFALSGSPDDIVAQLSSGEADIAALPTNWVAVLYQKTNQSLQVLAINTLGVLYILEKGDTIHSLSDLSGRELLATGQGSVPEYVLNDLLANDNLAKPVQITYKGEHAELATLAAAGKADLLMLPEPFVTTVLSKNPDLRIALDLTTEWQKMNSESSGSELAMGCLVVTKKFAQENPDAVKAFLSEYEVSTNRVNSEPQAAGDLIVKYQIMADAGLAAKAIPNCHIVMIPGTPMQAILEPFYEILFKANPKSVGGVLPDSNFYWIS